MTPMTPCYSSAMDDMTFMQAVRALSGPSIKVYKDSSVPLARTEPDGRVVPIMCVKVPVPRWPPLQMLLAVIGGDDVAIPAPITDWGLLVHPDRWDAFIAMFPPGTAPRDSTPTPTEIAPESADAFAAWRKDGPDAG